MYFAKHGQKFQSLGVYSWYHKNHAAVLAVKGGYESTDPGDSV